MCSTSHGRMLIIRGFEFKLNHCSTGSQADWSMCDFSPRFRSADSSATQRTLHGCSSVTLWLCLSNLDSPLRSRLVCLCTVSFEELFFCSDLNIPLNAPPTLLFTAAFHRLRLFVPLSLWPWLREAITPDHQGTFKKGWDQTYDSVNSKISDLVNVINLKLSSHFSPCFFPSILSLLFSFSGLHPLQNSYCPGQRGDRLLLLEDDCLHRDQDREWIPTSNWVLTITFIFKCQPCTPPKPTFCVWVFFFQMVGGIVSLCAFKHCLQP